MKKIALIASVLLVISSVTYAQKHSVAKADPAKAVRAAFDRLIDGIKQVDADKVLAAYEKSERLLVFNNNGSATIGWDNVKNNVTSSYVKAANVSLDVTGVRVEMLGTLSAYVSCKWVQRQEYDGKLENASGRMTLIYRKIGTEWKIVHRHTSPDNPGPTRPVLPSERAN